MRKQVSKKSRLISVIVGILAVIWLIITFVPFMFMLFAALKEQFELMMGGVFDLPKKFYLGNFIEVFQGNIYNYFKNSIIVLVVSLVILLALSACAAYPLSRFKFKLNKPIYGIIVACMSVPIHVTLLPIFMMAIKTGMYDKIWALIGPDVAFNLPISVFILVTFMSNIPKELEEAAEIDGCNKYRIFYNVILPLSKPGLVTLAIYNGVAIWNEFSFTLVLTQSTKNRTLPLALWEYQGQYTMNVPMIMAVLTISMLPMLVAFAIGQDKLIKGMMAGAVKG